LKPQTTPGADFAAGIVPVFNQQVPSFKFDHAK
jgi:hypothetical protein